MSVEIRKSRLCELTHDSIQNMVQNTTIHELWANNKRRRESFRDKNIQVSVVIQSLQNIEKAAQRRIEFNRTHTSLTHCKYDLNANSVCH